MLDDFFQERRRVIDPTARLSLPDSARIRTRQFGLAARKNARDPKISSGVGRTVTERQKSGFDGRNGYNKNLEAEIREEQTRILREQDRIERRRSEVIAAMLEEQARIMREYDRQNGRV